MAKRSPRAGLPRKGHASPERATTAIDAPASAGRAVGNTAAETPAASAMRVADHDVLAGSHRLELARKAAGDELQIRAADGTLALSVMVSSAGVAVKIQAATLDIVASDALSIEADTLALRARSGMDIDGGQRLAFHAEEQRFEATRGGIAMEASDDVTLDGERVLLNCAKSSPVPGKAARDFCDDPDSPRGSE